MDKARVILVNEHTKASIVLPRNPSGLQEERSPRYSSENTPAGAQYEAATFESGGARNFGFTFVMLPDVDGPTRCTEVMVFLEGLLAPVNYQDPRDGVTRLEPPDVTFIFGSMVRRGKLFKRAANYGLLDSWAGCRELVVELQIRPYVRAVPPPKNGAAGGTGDGAPNYDAFQQKNVEDFLKAEGANAPINLRTRLRTPEGA